jgi:hypothetical protein
MAELDIEGEVRAAILAAGLGVEQIGLADGVQLEVDEDGQITMYFGEEGQQEFDDVDDARELIKEYADEYGATGSRPGAIVELVRRLGSLVERRAPERRAEAFGREHYGNMLSIADKLGLEYRHKVYVGDLEVQADDDGDVGYFEDGNEVIWHVFVEDGDVRYEILDRSP